MAPNASEDRQKPTQPRVDEIDRQEMEFRIPRERVTARRSVGGRVPRKQIASRRAVTMNARRAVIAAREEERRAQETTEAGERQGARDTEQVCFILEKYKLSCKFQNEGGNEGSAN